MKTIPHQHRVFIASLLAVAVSLVASGCYETVQTSSGQQYLARYDTATMGNSAAGSGAANDIDRRVAEVAAVEPMLRFPARLGLARIDHGRLVSIPPGEMEAWKKLGEQLGSRYGEFVPLNLFVAEMVYTSGDNRPPVRSDSSLLRDAIDRIRLGAARQHLDAVLIYEVALSTEINTTGWSLIDWTIVGLAANTRRSHVTAETTALLIDVRNGYPYGTAAASAENETSTAAYGSEEKLRDQRDGVILKAVNNLTPHIETMMQRLMAQLPDV